MLEVQAVRLRLNVGFHAGGLEDGLHRTAGHYVPRQPNLLHRALEYGLIVLFEAVGGLHAADEGPAGREIGNLVQHRERHPGILQVQHPGVEAGVSIKAPRLHMEAVHQHVRPDGFAGVAERHGGILEEDISRLAGVHEHIGHRDALREQEHGPTVGHRVRNRLETGLKGGQGLLGRGDVDIVEPVARATGHHQHHQGAYEQFLHIPLVIPGLTNPHSGLDPESPYKFRKSLCFSVIISKILRIFA